MAERKLEPEVEEILTIIEQKNNFLLSGGAGSGKTYSLVHVIAEVLERQPMSNVACITYTNAAVKQIRSRIDNPNLYISTIHDFLWGQIKQFKSELRKELIKLVNDEESKIKNPTDEELPEGYFDNLDKGIQYKEWVSIKDGIISHDELIELAAAMFKNHPLLCSILKDRFQFIFIDEYQDTHPNVIEILLVNLKNGHGQNIIGFFGDSMQSIYDDTIGDLHTYVDSGDLQEVLKKQNRRSPLNVINLANQIRFDNIKQEPSNDDAPNMQNGSVKQGDIKFVFSKDKELEEIKEIIGWDSRNIRETKELNLTHNLIAPRAKFESLMAIYDKDRIIEYKGKITKHIKETKITKDFSDYTFGEVIDELNIKPTPVVSTFLDENKELYNEARSYPFELFRKIYLDTAMLLDDKKDDEEDEGKPSSQRDDLIKHLFKIEHNIHLYSQGRYNEFISKTEFRVNKHADKVTLKEIVTKLSAMDNSTIEEVIEYAHNEGICFKDDRLKDFIAAKLYVYNRVKKVTYKEFKNLYTYMEGFTPFSTQHKIKGDEFENVLVVLDNGGWNKYNFKNLFHDSGKDSVLLRTKKLFYVCCTRAKERLVVFYSNPDQKVLEKARLWFGNANVIDVDGQPVRLFNDS